MPDPNPNTKGMPGSRDPESTPRPRPGNAEGAGGTGNTTEAGDTGDLAKQESKSEPGTRSSTRTGGRTRDESAKAEIFEATRQLARRQSYCKITIGAIARKAHVAKSTIYRWWPSKPHLVYEAIFSGDWTHPNEGDLRRDLKSLLTQYMESQLEPQWSALQLGLWADLTSEESKDKSLAQEHMAHFGRILQRSLDRAVRRGELRRRPDGPLITSLLTGSVRNMRLRAGIPMKEVPLDAIIDLVYNGLLADQ